MIHVQILTPLSVFELREARHFKLIHRLIVASTSQVMQSCYQDLINGLEIKIKTLALRFTDEDKNTFSTFGRNK